MSEEYLKIDPANVGVREMHGHLLGAVGPRPIALASTLDRDGRPNLAPFSYFNVFSVRPPILIFGPNRSGRTGQNKDTAHNALDTFEVVVNVVTYDMTEQMNVASADFAPDVDEFAKSGFTPLPSELVAPPRVAESPVQFECKVREVKVVGGSGGSGNLVVCEVLRMHVHPRVLDEAGKIDPRKIDLIGRMGGLWYVRANGEALYEVQRPGGPDVAGFDGLPATARASNVLTGNELGKLANVSGPPTSAEARAWAETPEGRLETLYDYHQLARAYLAKDDPASAWLAVLTGEATFGA